MWRVLVLTAACGVPTLACGAVSGNGTRTVDVFAAASLADAFADLEEDFEASHPDIDVRLNLAGSSRLREQILEGAPADVFASADLANVDPLIEADLVVQPAAILARNTLAIAVPSGNPGAVDGVDSFGDEGLLLGACAPGVPCGDLAAEMFAAAAVEPQLDTEEANVRSLLAKVISGDLDAGVVYVTDVLAEPEAVDAVGIPAAANPVTEYPIVQLRDAPNAAGAREFIDFATSADARHVLESYGFGAP